MTPLPGAVLVAIDTVASFEVMEERDTTRPGIMHVPHGWTKIHLSFTTADGRMNVAVTDNGAAIIVISRTSRSCSASSVSSSYYQYGTREDESHLYEAMAYVFDMLLEKCPGGMEAAREYRREFQRARREFPAAIRAMKARVSRVFGWTARCETPLGPYDPMAWMELTRRCNFD